MKGKLDILFVPRRVTNILFLGFLWFWSRKDKLGASVFCCCCCCCCIYCAFLFNSFYTPTPPDFFEIKQLICIIIWKPTWRPLWLRPVGGHSRSSIPRRTILSLFLRKKKVLVQMRSKISAVVNVPLNNLLQEPFLFTVSFFRLFTQRPFSLKKRVLNLHYKEHQHGGYREYSLRKVIQGQAKLLEKFEVFGPRQQKYVTKRISWEHFLPKLRVRNVETC